MFEAAELGRKISKAEFDRVAPELRTEMVEIQQSLRRADYPVILVFAGVDGAGKSESANLLNEWMDPRWIQTQVYGDPTREEIEKPEYWRYWRDLPPKGQFAIFLSAWYSRPVLDHVYGATERADLDAALDRINSFEKTLTDDGALVLKFWMHLSQPEQKKRLKKLERNPDQSWRVTKADWKNYKNYDRFIAAAERTLMRTSTGDAPWMIVEGTDSRYRSLTVLSTIRDAVRKHLTHREAQRKIDAELKAGRRAAATKKSKTAKAPATVIAGQPSILDKLDMGQSVSRETYRAEIRKLRARLHALYRQSKAMGFSTLVVFEGWDAGGKGGTIRRMVSALDARDYRVLPFAAPTDEEAARHYLWRFWRHIPRAGRFTVFDRSWYGRVLVERVEGFASEHEWSRSYAEINDFEAQLVEHGSLLLKFWMNITKEEQEQRFKNRQEIPYKRWKLTEEDWRNREKWDEYELAVNEMVERTSTLIAPWTLVEANDKRFARLKVVRTLCDRLQTRIEG